MGVAVEEKEAAAVTAGERAVDVEGSETSMEEGVAA